MQYIAAFDFETYFYTDKLLLIMIKLVSFLLMFFVFTACQTNTLTSTNADETKTFITHDTIPGTRDSISKEPVAFYTSSKGEKLQVKVYQTQLRFQFLMTMKYKFLNEKDTLRIPNFGIQPHIVIQNGADNQSCIIGFLDQKKEFKEYKSVSVASGNLKLKVLKQYYTGVYRTVFDDTTKAQ